MRLTFQSTISDLMSSPPIRVHPNSSAATSHPRRNSLWSFVSLADFVFESPVVRRFVAVIKDHQALCGKNPPTLRIWRKTSTFPHTQVDNLAKSKHFPKTHLENLTQNKHFPARIEPHTPFPYLQSPK